MLCPKNYRPRPAILIKLRIIEQLDIGVHASAE